MRKTTETRRLACLTMIVLAAALPACGGSPHDAAAGRSADALVPYDHGLTDVARVLAGQMPEDRERFKRVIGRATWKAHKLEFDANWTRSERARFRLMRGWRDQEFRDAADTCDTLLYPFGGPDLLNAYVLFPTCNTYLLFGLEPPGTVPALDRMPDKHIDDLLADLRESLADVFVRNYFITKRMMTELRTPEIDGNLPLYLAFLARLDARIVGIDRDVPWKELGATGVTIRFVAANSDRVQTLSYVKVQMEDPAFSQKVNLLSYLRGLGPVTTFIKSASYLMHDDRFSTIRGIVLSQSRIVLQDDSGLPYRFFRKDPGWDITLYGHYRKPIKDFNYGFQADLDEAYKRPSGVKPLPFSFGYHWGDGGSSVMLAVRKATGE